MIRDRFISSSSRRRVDGHGTAGDQAGTGDRAETGSVAASAPVSDGSGAATATPPSSQDFTSTLRSLLARELTEHDPDTERIRARIAAMDPSAARHLAPAARPVDHPVIPAPRTTPLAGTTSPAGAPPPTGPTPSTGPVEPGPAGTPPPAGAAARPRATARQRRPRRTRPRLLIPTVVGTAATALVGVVLLSGTLFTPRPDTGTVTAAPTRIPRAASADAGNAPPADSLGVTPAPSSAGPPSPAPGDGDPAVLSPEGLPSQGAGTSAAPSGAPDGPASQSDQGTGGSAPRDTRPGSGDNGDNGAAPRRDDSRHSGGRDGSGSADRGAGEADTPPGRDGARRDSGGSGGSGGVSVSTAPFSHGQEVSLPTAGCLDWVLFGADGVQTRADIPRPGIGTARIERGPGSGSGGFANRFSWRGGRPVSSGSRDDDRLVIEGSVRLDVALAGQARRLDLYLGSPDGSVRVTVGDGRNAWSRSVALSARQRGDADGVLSVWLPRGQGSIAVTVAAGSGVGLLTLAAGVLY
ncbi:hypothetical protein [Parafrankia sp. BMG5.11]|uniref:hypothetical protein n=1 Tax=Parafrankia sp. BMG5.11 TaxID=222540 RepID=UPI000DA5283F|nr:hypothetical protein [Parafrankia sp. BMG5.11]TCJ40700.1 hypothetical protein E0504_03735 [Parafrankia sp. BMG5.11]SQE00125.1 conserved hypothetical protein [Parafrankia sp. Ea1.12]